MKIAIFLAAVAVALPFVIGQVANGIGPEVAARFLERDSYKAEGLRHFVKSEPDQARGYAYPVLFPLDLLFMIFLGGFLAIASMASAESIPWLRGFAWAFVVAPAAYVASDLVEDVLLARMLTSLDVISESSVGWARTMTLLKFATSIIAILQTIALSALSLWYGR